MQPQPKCRMSGLTKSYGSRLAVQDFSLEIQEGEFIVLLGPSGCGKTTTLRMVAGLASHDTGSISIDGKVVSAPERGIFVRPEHRNIGMVFQSYAIWPHMTVFENVAYPLRVRRVPGAELRARVDEVLALVGLVEEVHRPAPMLSGGQMQRVALARALVSKPSMLLFDEPLSNLDLKLRERLRTELKDLQRRAGLTSLYVTHDQAEAVELADRIVVMQDGKAVQIGSPTELYRQPQTRFVAEFISTANIFDGVVERVTNGSRAMVRTEGGRRFLATYERPVREDERVEIVVHPEDCQLTETNGAAENSFPVEVRDQRFQGTSTRYRVDWGGQPLDVTVLGTASLGEYGSDTRVVIPPEKIRIIPQRP